MKRFKCFNNIMQNNSSTDEDEKDDDDIVNEPDAEGDDDQAANYGGSKEEENEVKLEVTLPEPVKVDTEYADSAFWKDDLKADSDLDDLLADYE